MADKWNKMYGTIEQYVCYSGAHYVGGIVTICMEQWNNVYVTIRRWKYNDMYGRPIMWNSYKDIATKYVTMCAYVGLYVT